MSNENLIGGDIWRAVVGESESLRGVVRDLVKMNNELKEQVESLWTERHVHLKLINDLNERLSHATRPRTPLEQAVDDFCDANHNMNREYIAEWFRKVFELGAESIGKVNSK